MAELITAPLATQNYFPFLSLPPELRERIYELVFGGHTLHVREIPIVRNSNRRVAVYRCRARITELDTFDSADLQSQIHRCPLHGFHTRHADCFESRSLNLPLHILTVCKAIHREAKGAILAYNTIGFHAPETVRKFANLVGHDAFRQIRHVLLFSTNRSRLWSNVCPELSRATSLFGQIFSLDVFVELVPSDFLPQYANTLDSAQERAKYLEGLRGFRCFAPRRVRVLINDNVETHPHVIGGLHLAQNRASKVDMREWAEQVKHMILPPPSSTDALT